MKIYIRANTQKPTLDYIRTEWEDLENGIKFTIYSDDDEMLFEEVFDYDDVDSDAIPGSAADMAILVLSQKYDLSDDVVATLKSEVTE